MADRKSKVTVSVEMMTEITNLLKGMNVMIDRHEKLLNITTKRLDNLSERQDILSGRIDMCEECLGKEGKDN
jgi:hypothetical protein